MPKIRPTLQAQRPDAAAGTFFSPGVGSPGQILWASVAADIRSSFDEGSPCNGATSVPRRIRATYCSSCAAIRIPFVLGAIHGARNAPGPPWRSRRSDPEEDLCVFRSLLHNERPEAFAHR